MPIIEGARPRAASAANSAEMDTLAAAIPVAAEADLNQTISDPPTQAEVQAISDKVDALLAKLRTAGVIAAS
jgi:hypothetical protein